MEKKTLVKINNLKSKTMLAEATVNEFMTSLRGTIVTRRDKGYDDARKVHNGMIDKKPLMIVYCKDVADVISSVNFARNNDVLLSIRSGGHSASGLGICDDGMVIDLSGIKYTRIDPEAKTVVVGAGCTLADLDHATHAFGMATPSGILGTTGIGGITLGGGLGHFTRQYGLAIDNLLEVDVVLADGSFVTANKDKNEDLFWAVRGGGGNFGVVTAFKFKLHPIDTVYAGPILYELSEAEEVMKWYRDFLLKHAPADLNGFFAFLTIPPAPMFPEQFHLKPMCGVIWSYTGPLDKAEKVFKPIRSFKTPAIDLAGPIPHPVLQGLFDGLYAPGLQWYWKADFFKELTDEAISKHYIFARMMPTWMSGMHLYPVNGAASKVGKKDTAWNFRDAEWAGIILGVDADPANKEKISDWALKYWEALHPYSAGGAYVNFMMEEGENRVKASYGDNYERLVTVKNKYDPGNLFRVNQNIKPTIGRRESL
jgi:FAD/FMN-containing dehydrogenase